MSSPSSIKPDTENSNMITIMDTLLTVFAVLFLPILPFVDILTQYSKHTDCSLLSIKEQWLPTVLSVGILTITISVAITEEYNESIIDTVAFLNRVLTFLLPLNLTACIAKNKLGLSKFRSMCMEFQEVAWQVQGLVKGKQDTTTDNIMNTLKYLPEIIKHDIRKDGKIDDINSEEIQGIINNSKRTKNSENLSYILLEQLHKDIAELSKRENKENKPNVNVPSVNNLFRGMNKAVGFLSDIQSIQAYLLPDIFFGFFYIVVLAYFTLLPLSIDDSAGACVWKCYTQLYVFMGMFFVGLYIQNAFRSSSFGIQTVKKIHKDHRNMFHSDMFSKQTLHPFTAYSDNLFTKRYY